MKEERHPLKIVRSQFDVSITEIAQIHGLSVDQYLKLESKVTHKSYSDALKLYATLRNKYKKIVLH